MHPKRWYRLLAAGGLLLSHAGHAQGRQATYREIASLPGVAVSEWVRLPNGRVLLYTVGDSVMAYDLATRRATLTTRGFFELLRVSRAGDRIAFCRLMEDGKRELIWSMPIDPATGAATGPAQRVSMTPGDYPSLSPDGKVIAFRVDRDVNRNLRNGSCPGCRDGAELAVVPATGGAERIVADFGKGLRRTAWSADGKFILVEILEDSTVTIERVPAAGGSRERIFSSSGKPNPRRFGPLDGRTAFFTTDGYAWLQGRMGYATASGARGEINIPFSTRLGEDVGADPILARWFNPSTAHRLNVADGTVRDLVPGAAQSRAPVWSPDGRRIAVQVLVGGRWGITVMNADGSQPKRYPVEPDPNQMRWSPNGAMVAFYTGGRASLAVLDLATGTSRVLSSVREGVVAGYIWRPDSKSIVLGKEGITVGTAMYEARIDGTERKLRNVESELPGGYGFGFISDERMIVGTNAAPTEQFMMSTEGDQTQKLSEGNRKFSFGLSEDGKTLLWQLRNPGPDMTVELMTVSGESLRTLKLPFELADRNRTPPFTPDGKQVILIGRTPGESTPKIFLVPLDGGAPRELATLTGAPYATGRLDLSPDGKTLVFTTDGVTGSELFALDVTPVLRTLKTP